MNTSTDARPRPTTPAQTDKRPVGGNRLADYVVDVFFIVLLAAPFVIFQSPATVQEAVVSHGTETNIVSTAAAAAPAQPAGAQDSTYGPQ